MIPPFGPVHRFCQHLISFFHTLLAIISCDHLPHLSIPYGVNVPMSFLQNTTLLPSIGHGSKTNGACHHQIRPRGSIASLTRLIRNPIESVGEAVEGWYDGSTKEERAQKQFIEERKQILYLKLREVGTDETIGWSDD